LGIVNTSLTVLSPPIDQERPRYSVKTVKTVQASAPKAAVLLEDAVHNVRNLS
jgi:hypothetical protein